MTLRWFAAAFLLSLLVPLLEGLLPAVPLARGSLAALALLPWLALATLPRAERKDGVGEKNGADPSAPPWWRATLFAGCLALPPLALGVGIDLARGAEPLALAPAAAAAWVALVLWVGAAERAARAARARAPFAWLWLALLPGAAALRLALAWVPLRASSVPAGRSPLFALDPLVWCHRWGRPGALESPAYGELALAVLAAALVLLAVTALASRPAAEVRAEPGA